MTTSLADGGAGIGACLGAERAELLSRQAGFTHFRVLNADSTLATVYEVR